MIMMTALEIVDIAGERILGQEAFRKIVQDHAHALAPETRRGISFLLPGAFLELSWYLCMDNVS